jgi:hypothetical protein
MSTKVKIFFLTINNKNLMLKFFAIIIINLFAFNEKTKKNREKNKRRSRNKKLQNQSNTTGPLPKV